MKLSSIRLDNLSSSHLYYVACLIVLISAAALRFYNLSEHSLWLDEAVAANNSRGTFWEVALYTRHRNSSPLLYPYMLWAIQLVDSSPFSVRFIPALASTLTVAVFLFLFPLVGTSRAAAFIAGLLAALSTTAIEHARDVREYGVDALVAALLIVCLLLYLRDRRKLPLCIALFIAPTLQYGLGLFSVAIIATILVGVSWTDFRNHPRSRLADQFRGLLRIARDIRLPLASFVAGCAIALLTLSGQWSGTGWAVSGYLQQSYYQGRLYKPVDVVEFVPARVWLMIGYQIWEIIAVLTLVSFAVVLARSWRRLRFDAIPIIFLFSIAIASCAALLKAYPIGDIRQNIYLGPVVFVASGYALHSVVNKFTHPLVACLAISAMVVVVIIGGIYTLAENNPYKDRSGIKQALATLEDHRLAGEVAYIGRYASPIVQFYDRSDQDYYFHGNCVGSDRMDVEECARDLADKIRVILYSRAHIDSPVERMYLMFHDEVSAHTISELVGEFYEGDAELKSLAGGTLYVIENFRQIAVNSAPTIDEIDRGNLIISSEYNVYLDDGELTYINRQCNPYDTAATFFLHLVPINRNDIPVEHANAGFDKLEFTFGENGIRNDRLCVTTRTLPEYEVKRIRTGQYIPLKFFVMGVWESGWRDISSTNVHDGQ